MGPLYLKERTATRYTEGWVGLRVALDGTERVAHTGTGSPNRPGVASRYTDCAMQLSSRVIIIIISNLSNGRSKASSKTIPPHSAI